MDNIYNKPNETSKKLNRLNNSINKMLDCVNFLEKMRSNNVISSISEEELEKVMSYMTQVEKSIEKINQKKSNKGETLYKAVGKNKKYWVKKELETRKDLQSNNFKTNPIQKTGPTGKSAQSNNSETKDRKRPILFRSKKK